MAESIWNNNYLLSNLDAQKLYAQSPLTTGVSGSSAYIGIEPSARYNETVLFEGSSANPTLSESVDNFEKFDIVYTYWPSNYTTRTLYGLSGKPTFTEGWFNEAGTFGGIFITRLTANDSHTVIGSDSNKYWNPPTGTSTSDAISNFKICKVVGINRKENV